MTNPPRKHGALPRDGAKSRATGEGHHAGDDVHGAQHPAEEHAGRKPAQTEHEIEGTMRELKDEVEDTAEDVLHAFRRGRDDAIEAAERTIPAVKRAVAKGTYVFCYYLSFGVVYTAELAMAAVPQDSPIRAGFRDGAAAARDAHEHRRGRRQYFIPQTAAT